MFKFRDDNRVLNEKHIRSLAKNMKENGWIPGSYCVVNPKMETIDGQHRIKAAEKAGVPVRYTIENVKSEVRKVIRGLNQDQKNWAFTDFIHTYVSDGNINYARLEAFMETYPDIRPTECMMMCLNSNSSPSREIFESGKFLIKDMRVADTWAKNVLLLKPYFENGYNKSIFVRALIKLFVGKPEFNFTEFLHKVELRPGSIHLCGTVEQYIDMIETIYNYRRKNEEKINLRFF